MHAIDAKAMKCVYLQLVVLNLGGNRLSHMPDCLEKMSELQTLHLFGNSIESLDDKILSKHKLSSAM